MEAPIRLSAVLELLREDETLQLLLLWHTLFPNAPVALEDLEDELLSRIDKELFPVDLNVIWQGYMEIGEPLFNCALWIEPFSIAWEDGCSLDSWHMARCVGYPLYGLLMECASGTMYDVEDFPDVAIAYLDAHGIYLPEDSGDVVCCYQDMISVLESLRPPLDGTAFVLKCLCRRDGNLFIDYSPDDENSAFDYLYGFNENDIRELAAMYNKIRTDVQKYEAYQAWFNATPLAEDIVLRAVVSAVFGTEVLDGEDF